MHKNMYYKNLIIDIFAVTFRKEGVDWNPCRQKLYKVNLRSPSARKVWIEILLTQSNVKCIYVTFRKEGVDWNLSGAV